MVTPACIVQSTVHVLFPSFLQIVNVGAVQTVDDLTSLGANRPKPSIG